MGEAKVLGQTFHVICYGVFQKHDQRSTSHGAVDLNHQAPQLDGVLPKNDDTNSGGPLLPCGSDISMWALRKLGKQGPELKRSY
jgi:hypothetical protein